MASVFMNAASGFAGQTTPTVVVVGAGLAGLTTAYRLKQKGIEVQVYEARSRVGGRVFSAKIGDDEVELGGQNITDGGDAENLRRLIDEFQLELKVNRYHHDYHYFNGEEFLSKHLLIDKKFTHEDLKIQLAQVVQRSHNMKDVLDGLLKEEDPLYRATSVTLAAYEGAPPEKLSTLYANTLYHMLLGGICSVHPSVEQEENCIDIVSIKGGNALLPEELARLLGERVHLNMPLVAVSKGSEGAYELVFQNGQRVKADIVVLAIPCSVYQDIVFEGNLIPEKKLESIKSVQYGTNAKILIPFPKPPERKGGFINDRICCFFGNSKVLSLIYTGDAARFSEDTILEAYLREQPMLEKGFKDLYSSFSYPAFARDEFLVSYEGSIGYSWPNDPYAKGSYSYIAPGQEVLLAATHSENGEKVRTLFAPIDNTLFFAGEHATILAEVPGTMEAACESGERTARMIEQCVLR